jgi:parallel beta-helix repeat protein
MSLRHTQRTRVLAAVAIIALAAVPVLASTDGRRGASEAANRLVAPSPAPLVAPRTGGAATRVVVGPVHAGRRGPVLRATVHRPRARIVAVSFFAGSRALGTDTTAPFRLDVVTGELSGRGHSVRAVAVDRLGRRTTSRDVTVAAAKAAPAVTARPTSGLASALARLRAGHVTVRLTPGRYALSNVELGPGARLIGSGPATVLAPARGTAPWALLNLRGKDIRVADLTVDGERRARRAVAVADGSADVRLSRLRVRRVLVNAIEAWGAHRDVSTQDSVLDGRGASNAGVFDLGSDNSRDVSVVRTRIFGFRGYGVAFAQRFYDRPTTALHNLALDDDVSGIVDPGRSDGRSESGIWTGGVAAAIVGNRVRHTGTDAIQTVGSSTRTTIVANAVARAPVGIYLEHSTNASLIARNRISDVGTGINVEWRHAGGGSSANTFAANTVTRAAQAGMFLDVGSDANRLEDNRFVGGARPAIVLQGSSGNLVRANRGCGSAGRMITEQAGRRETGAVAASRDNRLVGNVGVRACGG